MKKIIIVLLIGGLCGCVSMPKNFTYFHIDEPEGTTGIHKRIDIKGYYVSQHGCDSTFYSMYMFYSNGVFTIATTNEVSPELITCFEDGGKSSICKYPLWGEYRIVGDTIKTQAIRPEGGGCVIFRDYLITDEKELINISDYVEPQYTQMAYMKNYPSFRINECMIPAKFYPLKKQRSLVDDSLSKIME